MALVTGILPLPNSLCKQTDGQAFFPILGRAQHLSISGYPSSQPATQLLR